jgi:hypothetical protein
LASVQTPPFPSAKRSRRARAGTTRFTASWLPRRRGAAQAALEFLHGRGGRTSDTVRAGQGDAFHFVEAVDADDFLDDVGRAVRRRGASREGDAPLLAVLASTATTQNPGCRGCGRCSSPASPRRRASRPAQVRSARPSRPRAACRRGSTSEPRRRRCRGSARSAGRARVEELRIDPRSKRLRASRSEFSVRPVAAMRSGSK